MEEFKKQKELLSSLPPDSEKVTAGVKNPPRRRFEMSDRIRQMILNIIQIKMAMYKPPMQKSSAEESESSLKLAYIQQFFDNELIPLWPKNWMQKNVLLNIYNIKYCQQQQKQQQQQQQQASPIQQASVQRSFDSSIQLATSILSSQQFPNKQTPPLVPYAVTPPQSMSTSTSILSQFPYQVWRLTFFCLLNSDPCRYTIGLCKSHLI